MRGVEEARAPHAGDPVRQEDLRRSVVVVWTIYGLLGAAILTEKFGRTTSDTRLDLTEAPVEFLRSTFSLWNPRVSLGELQNQAYGYLFPQGSFFALGEVAGLPGWVTERLWSFLLVVVAAEGVRRVCLALALNPWGAALAGLVYAVGPRHVAELGVRSAEILPGAVLPWALLPLVHLVRGRRRPLPAALLSAAAFAFSGGVNGTATAAPAGLLAVVVLWAWATRRVRASFVAQWGVLMVAVNLWWGLALLRLGAYSPPFYDYVETAADTTRTAGWSAAMRGASNWVNYIEVNGALWWPAGYDVSVTLWPVIGSGLLALLGLIGLARYRGELRTPLLLSAALGLALITGAHVSPLDGPLAPVLRDLLDGSLAPLRNIAKADPILRVPLAIGVAVLAHQLLGLLTARRRGDDEPGRRRPLALRLARQRASAAVLSVVVLPGALVATSLPVLQGQLRTPGWEEVPSHWQEASRFLDESPADGAAWVVPGSGFAIQTWGWTMEEPLQVLGSSNWLTRSQVPLTPAATIRMLSTLEDYVATGAGSPFLRNMLRRVGVDRVLVRHDLDPTVSLATPPALVSLALARSPGVERVATFGQVGLGPAIEVFEVLEAGGERPRGALGAQVRDLDDALTVAGSVEDVLRAVGAGLVGDEVPSVVRGESGWEREVDVLGDGLRLRERGFHRVNDAVSQVMTAQEGYRTGRNVVDYPTPPGATPVAAVLSGIAGVRASSSGGYADILGPVRPENAPWSALDGQEDTFWRSAPFADLEAQWWEVDLGEVRAIDEVVLQQPLADGRVSNVTAWRVVAGGRSVEVRSEAFTGRAVVDLGGVPARRLRIEVADVEGSVGFVGLAEVDIEGVDPGRTLSVPEVPLAEDPVLLFDAAAERRACITTLLGPDCDPGRQRASEEAAGMDRSVVLQQGGRFDVRGLVVARSRPATTELLRPLAGAEVRVSSTFENDPTVSARLLHDGDPRTSWIADRRDREPVLRIDLGRRRTVARIRVTDPAPIAARPVLAVLEGRGETRTVDLRGNGRFEPFRARNLTVTLSRPDDASRPTLGMSELELGPADIAAPLEGRSPTGAVCGFGPTLVVNGEQHLTRVEGQVGSVLSNGQLAVRTCDGPVRLEPGENRVELRSTEQFQPVSLELDAREPSGFETRSSRTVDITARSDTRVEMDVSAGKQAILSLPQSFNEGWVATAGGVRLEPIQVDGWSQGWLVPEDVAGEVVATFTPQRPYLVALLGGLGLLGAVLLSAAAVLVRTRLAPASPAASRVRPRRRARRAGRWAGVRVGRVATGLLVGAGAWVVGGPVVAAGALLGMALRGRQVLALTLGGTAVYAAVLAYAAEVLDRATLPGTTVDLVTGFGVSLVLVAALAAPSRPTPSP